MTSKKLVKCCVYKFFEPPRLAPYQIWITPHLPWDQKWWYLGAMCFVRGVNLCDVAIMMHNWMSWCTLHTNVGVFTWTGKTLFISFRRVISGMTSRSAWERAMYSASDTVFARIEEISPGAHYGFLVREHRIVGKTSCLMHCHRNFWAASVL